MTEERPIQTNRQFLEKIDHFDRERIRERVVHARGFALTDEQVLSGVTGVPNPAT